MTATDQPTVQELNEAYWLEQRRKDTSPQALGGLLGRAGRGFLSAFGLQNIPLGGGLGGMPMPTAAGDGGYGVPGRLIGPEEPPGVYRVPGWNVPAPGGGRFTGHKTQTQPYGFRPGRFTPYLYTGGAGVGGGGIGSGYFPVYYGGRGGGGYRGYGAAPTRYGGGVGTGRITPQRAQTAGRYGLGMVNWRI